MVGNIFQVFAAAIAVFDTNNISTSTEILIGFGCMLAFVNLGRYIEYAENYSTIFTTITRALPNVCRYLLGVSPIFLGFILFGLCVFWKSERFTSTSNIMIILFALAQGDSVYDAFKDLTGIHFFIGQLYLYLFCLLFIVVVLNIFIAIIEEAYVSCKMENKTHWVYDYMKKDDKNIMELKDDPNNNSLIQNNNQNHRTSNDSLYEKPQNKSTHNLKHSKYSNNNQHKPSSHFQSASNLINSNASSYEPPKLAVKFEDKNTGFIIDNRNYERQIDEEFEKIENNIKEIIETSNDVIKRADLNTKDEIRTIVFDQVNAIESKTQELRNILNKSIN